MSDGESSPACPSPAAESLPAVVPCQGGTGESAPCRADPPKSPPEQGRGAVVDEVV